MKNSFLLLTFLLTITCHNIAIARDFDQFDVISEINNFNKKVAENSQERFNEKLDAMSADLFSFMRGSAHLMNRDLQKASSLELLRTAPTGMVAGDLHMHNFSIAKSGNRQAIYAIDDLDEAYADAPLSFDIFRLSVSLLTAYEEELTQKEQENLVKKLCAGYSDRAADPETYEWPEMPKSEFIKNFIADESDVKWSKFIKKRTSQTSPNSFNYEKYSPVSEQETLLVKTALNSWFSTMPGISADQAKILDISQRFDKGLSSIGLKRYFVLLQGESKEWQDDCIVEVKQMRSSSIGSPTIILQQQATIEAMKRAHQGLDPFLGALVIGNDMFLARQNFPWSETIENSTTANQQHIMELAYTLGFVTADFHAREKKGIAMKLWIDKHIDTLIPIIFSYFKQLKADYKTFSERNKDE
ncbi:MAG: DUF2252 family protein [Candidatus Riflebacteria bacterium]|nr:DUF2252 family protein [Candidatus Riflebacteria bacterium]